MPEGINASEENPLKEFALLVLGVFGGLALLVLLLGYLADALVVYVPFSAEQHIAQAFTPKDTPNTPLHHYLQQMADRIAKAEDLPPKMHITVHYIDNDTVNAFATLGGNVMFFRGLLEKVPDENALAMVMAHEIGHVKTRAPLSGLGRGMVTAVVLGMVDSSLGDQLAGDVLGQTGLLTQMDYSRKQESEADRIGEAALEQTYGGVRGVDELFDMLAKLDLGNGNAGPEIYRSHPDIATRLASLHRQAQSHGWLAGKVVPLPAAFGSWLKDEPAESHK